MSKKIIGVEIGSFRIKLVDCAGTDDERIVVVNVPDNLVKGNKIVSWDAMAEFIKETARNNKIVGKEVAVAIPKDQVYSKRVNMPIMTKDQLMINLPFEFHDYITDEKDKYIFDYAVVNMPTDDNGDIVEMDLLAVAAEKNLIEQYRTMFQRAGMKLVIIAPEFSALRNIIKEYDERQNTNGQKDYAVVDLGHNSIKLHFFDKGEYETTRVMEIGMREIDEYIADALSVDIHTANLYKETNKDEILSSDQCVEIYNRIAVEVMRVTNFYDFNHPENNIDTLYCCGGGAMVSMLLAAIREKTEMGVTAINDLLDTEYVDGSFALEGILALGITRE